MSKNVSDWLKSLGLDQYSSAFDENAIDWDLLPDLDQETLKDIGVSTAGHRLRILKAALELNARDSAIKPESELPEKVPISGESSKVTGRFRQRPTGRSTCDSTGNTGA